MQWNERENIIFGLDIGTRTIIGIVGYQQKKEFVIIASEVVEHESRSMVDGQIHDISAVVRTVQKVKELLENQIGFSLEEVAIAAAGRVLQTVRVGVEQRYEEPQLIDELMIKALEMQAVKKAQEEVNSRNRDNQNEYFFVGHSVVHYYLNEYIIVNLEGQRGYQIGTDILATFLPKVVVESLYTVMDRVGLRVTNLTLEPIAAMNTVIPQNLRMLNLALVDIGAGTSDIAITKEGSVVAYGMIPLAGDEITEKLVHSYLVDFAMAENIKQKLTVNDEIEFQDIIGIPHKVNAKDIEEILKDTIENLANEIASRVLELNGNKSPNAVFCVGGGSQTAHITEIIAEKLSLPVERVAIRSSDHAVTIVDEMKKVTGPESITPLGICLTAMQKKEEDFIVVTVNNQTIKLFRTKQLTIADAALAIGFEHTQIIGARGKTLMFKLNGERIRIKGEGAKPSVILCNQKEASLETNIKDGDKVMIYPAQNGSDGQANLVDLINEIGLDKDEVIIRANSHIVDEAYIIQNGDDIVIEDNLGIVVSNVYDEESKQDNNTGILADVTKYNTKENINNVKAINKEAEKLMYVMVNGDVVSMPFKKDYLFVSIFDFIDFKLSPPQGSIVLKLNGERAAYTDFLKDGDKLEIYWE